jgi:hypothetical protein
MHKSRQYMLVYFPFLVIMISDVYYACFIDKESAGYFRKWRSSKPVRIALLFLLSAFLISGLYYNIEYSMEKFSPGQNAAITAKYIVEDPETLNIVAPMIFIFNEIERFHRIQADLCFYEMSKSDPSIQGLGLLEKTKEFDIRYIILSPFERARLGWEKPESLVLPEDYAILSGKDDEYLVIKRIN